MYNVSPRPYASGGLIIACVHMDNVGCIFRVTPHEIYEHRVDHIRENFLFESLCKKSLNVLGLGLSPKA